MAAKVVFVALALIIAMGLATWAVAWAATESKKVDGALKMAKIRQEDED